MLLMGLNIQDFYMMLVTGGVPSGEDFYEGRQKYVQELASKIEKQEIAVIGPRRTGKTSVVKTYFESLKNKDDRIPLYINLESCSNPYDIINEIAGKLLDQKSGIKAVFQNVTEKANEWTGKLKNIFDTVELGSDVGVTIKLKIRQVTEQKLERLGNEFKELCGSTERRLVVALDEIPEAIWKYVNNGDKPGKEERIRHIGILLSFFRDIRQTNKSSGNLRFIYSGSINFATTLKKLGFAEDHNDLGHFTIPFLSPSETIDVAEQLISGEKIQIESRDDLIEVLEKQFGRTTPYYVQLYVEQLKNITISKPPGYRISKSDLASAFQKLLNAEFGPEYFYRRIETYHPENKNQILKILHVIALNQTQRGTPTSVHDLTDVLKLPPLEIEDMLRSLFIEDFFQIKSGETMEAVCDTSDCYFFESAIIRIYWTKKLKNFA